ncbi:GNAT family N-acetyltransferase [Algihabitans sp.]|uniref:GNAT family N-acetyltransferase n=1 Tax=Algihabitans sp. TaxID=2821514 RepID=UPI003BAA9CC5
MTGLISMTARTRPRAADFTIERQIRADHIGVAAGYVWEAFGTKLNRLLGPAERAQILLRRIIRPEYGFGAVGPSGELLGVAGFKTPEGAFIDGSLKDLMLVYGLLGCAWRAPLLEVIERDCEDGVLLMDGICVAATARGQGIGSALIEAVVAEAGRRGLGVVRLDVVEGNPRARALYERQGFQAVDSARLGVFRHLFGFASSVQMRRAVPQLTA